MTEREKKSYPLAPAMRTIKVGQPLEQIIKNVPLAVVERPPSKLRFVRKPK